MTKRPDVTACGAVLLRRHKGTQQVLVIHRDRYDDWSLPKGKGKTDELHPETAIRELWEETGVHGRLDLRLGTVKHTVPKGRKHSHFWRASVVSDDGFTPGDEVDRIEWLDVKDAVKRLSYDGEKAVVQEAVAAPASTALLLVRHGKAMARKHWSGPDRKRQLSSRGRAQAQALRDLLRAFGVAETISSSATRCMETLAPYAKEHGLKTHGVDILTEEQGEDNPKKVVAYMEQLRTGLRKPTAVCGHRPVLPSMFEGLGVKPRPMVVGEAMALHYDSKGRVLAADVFKPTA